MGMKCHIRVAPKRQGDSRPAACRRAPAEGGPHDARGENRVVRGVADESRRDGVLEAHGRRAGGAVDACGQQGGVVTGHPERGETRWSVDGINTLKVLDCRALGGHCDAFFRGCSGFGLGLGGLKYGFRKAPKCTLAPQSPVEFERECGVICSLAWRHNWRCKSALTSHGNRHRTVSRCH